MLHQRNFYAEKGARQFQAIREYFQLMPSVACTQFIPEMMNVSTFGFFWSMFLWNKYKDDMADDILYSTRRTTANHELEMNDDIRNEALILIEDMCLLMCGSALCNLGMPAPNRPIHDAFNRELQRERDYDLNAINDAVRVNVHNLNAQQKNVYDTLMKAVNDGNGGFFFLDAPGGTGKTFLISLLLASIRSRSDIAVAVASSGIAATLLEGGRTAHSAFKLPLNLQAHEEPNAIFQNNQRWHKY